LFLFLALATVDVVSIDLSRFRTRLGGSKPQGRAGVALAMGAVSALLAGACVAPVVLAVLLLAVRIGPAGWMLPFVLGIGMALPWPLAGAGLSVLPKPGRWMVAIKAAMAAGILGLGLYHGYLGWWGFFPTDRATGEGTQGRHVVDGATNRGLAEALARARVEGKNVIIVFSAHWCKNCQAMEGSTLADSAVSRRLAPYLIIRYDADNPQDPETRAVLRRFSVRGFPTLVFLNGV